MYNICVLTFFFQIYKEDLLDLLLAPEKREKDTVSIREDTVGIKVNINFVIDSFLYFVSVDLIVQMNCH